MFSALIGRHDRDRFQTVERLPTAVSLFAVRCITPVKFHALPAMMGDARGHLADTAKGKSFSHRVAPGRAELLPERALEDIQLDNANVRAAQLAAVLAQ
jgi:hypothetical protein